MRKTIALITATGALAAAGVAQAKPVHYAGHTKSGDAIAFTLKHGRIKNVSSHVPTVCGTTAGGPRSGTSAFDPPGAFRLGHKGHAKAKRDNEMGVTSEVTKNYSLSTHRRKSGKITGRAHVDFSFLEVQYTYPISAKTFVCTGDAKFTAHPVR